MTSPFNSNDWFTLTVPSDVRALAVVRRTVEEVALIAGLSKRATYEAVLAVSEACANVVQHAYQGQPGGSFTIACRATPPGLEVRLVDQGQAFDFDLVPELPPAELREGGRGVFLIRKLMDEVSCSHSPETGNELRMVKRK